MAQADPVAESAAAHGPKIETSLAAVGIPQGLIADPATGEVEGAVRIGGKLASLTVAEYRFWVILLAPIPESDVPAAAASYGLDLDALNALQERHLVITIKPGAPLDDSLAQLRPLPLGAGVGNGDGDHTSFEIQNASLSLPSPVSVDPAGMMLWWQFDGTRPLGEVVRDVSSSLEDFGPDLIEIAATRLVQGLMANRLLYLDAPED